jgi:hypothetical protein
MLSTPAMNVVATAPRPGVSMPRRPVAGAIDLGAAPEVDLANFYLRFVIMIVLDASLILPPVFAATQDR